APPTLYFAIRNGQLIVKGSIADILTIEGSGTVGKDLALDGLVRITVPDIAKLVALSPNTASLPASGNFIVDLKLGGKLSPIEAALLQLFIKDMRADGHIVVNAGIAGTMSDPHITGSAEVQDGQFRFAGFPQIIDHVTGTLVFKSDRIEIDSLRATLGGGSVIAGGSIGVNGVKPTNVRLTLHGAEVAIRYYEGLTVDGNFDLLLSG